MSSSKRATRRRRARMLKRAVAGAKYMTRQGWPWETCYHPAFLRRVEKELVMQVRAGVPSATALWDLRGGA